MDRMTTTYHHDHDAKLGQFAKSGGGINNGLIITVLCRVYISVLDFLFDLALSSCPVSQVQHCYFAMLILAYTIDFFKTRALLFRDQGSTFSRPGLRKVHSMYVL